MSWLDKLRGRRTPDPTEETPTGVTSAPEPAAEAEWRAVEVVRAPLPFGEELVTARGGTAPRLLDAIDAELLRGAWPFRPLSVHARALSGRAVLEPDEAAARLAGLAAQGLLHTREQAREAMLGSEEAPMRISTVGVVSCDRPAMLQRALESHAASARAHGRAVERAVYDDSASPEVRAANRAIAQATEARYAGLEEKRAYLDRLAARVPDVPRALVALALGLAEDPPPGSRVGGNHTVGLLDGAGHAVISVDDDTTARVASVEREARLSFTGLHDATVFGFHADRAGALAAVEGATLDPVAVHERLLGRSVGALARAHPAIELDHASAALIRRLATPGARVGVSALGIAGDSGMGSPAYYLLLPPPSRDALFADYPAHRRTRAVVRAVPGLTVSAGTFLMAPSIGLDARTLLPPFFPYGRNQDGAYAVLLRTLVPDAYLGHLPAVVEHAPAEARTFAEDADARTTGRTLLADVLMHALEAAPLAHVHGDARFAATGAHLCQLAALPREALLEWVVSERTQRLAQQLGRLQGALEAPPPEAPEAWVSDVERMVLHLRAAAIDPERALPVGWLETFGRADALGRLSALLDGFGRLLSVWPHMYVAACALREEGLRPSTTA